jgi:hypothetical protein
MSYLKWALITLEEAKEFPGMSSLAAADEATVRALIDAASLAIEEHVQNPIVQRAFTEDYAYDDIRQSTEGSNRIYLRHYPIVSVASITDPAGETIDATTYWIDKPHGCLVRTSGWDMPKDANGWVTYWTIVYTAGRYANTALVPAHMKHACKAWVSQLYKRPDQSVTSKSVGDLSLSYEVGKSGEGAPAVPDFVKLAFSSLKRREV